MNNFAFNLIDAISCEGLGNKSWGVVEKDAVFSLQLDQIEPTMVLHVDDDCDIQLYNLD